MTHTYIGTKIVTAWPQDKEGAPGYAVKYADGYTSWSPAETFEEAYRQLDHGRMSFGMALEALKHGQKVARAGWNGKGMWLALSCPHTKDVPSAAFWNAHNAEHARQMGGTAKVLPSITMKTATNEILMGWLASQTDMLADDWVVVSNIETNQE